MGSFARNNFNTVHLDIEYKKTYMTIEQTTIYTPNDYESEKASNSYLMSVIAIMVGLPFPIINLVATFIFFLGNLKATKFVKWHCTQALLSQVFIVIMNGVGFSWTMSIMFGSNIITNRYLAYMITIVTFNIYEFIVTIRGAILTRKGKHDEWWIFGSLTNLIFRINK
jgi:hypothetical protein